VVVADLAEQAGAEDGADAGEAEEDWRVGMLAERLAGGVGELVGVGAGGLEEREQGQVCCPSAASTMAGWWSCSALSTWWSQAAVAAMWRRPDRPEVVELCQRQGCGGGWYRCGGKQDAQQRGGEAFQAGSDNEGSGVELAEQAAQTQLGSGAIPDGVLLGSSQNFEGAGEVAVRRELPVGSAVDPQDVGPTSHQPFVTRRRRRPSSHSRAHGSRGTSSSDLRRARRRSSADGDDRRRGGGVHLRGGLPAPVRAAEHHPPN
jgi:hypothetical protein